MPRRLVLAAGEDEGRRGWLATVPATVRALAERWSLEVGATLRARGDDGLGGTGAGAGR